MSLDARDFSRFVTIAREVVRLIDATTIAITDVPCGLTRNQIAGLINRYEQWKEPDSRKRPPNIADT